MPFKGHITTPDSWNALPLQITKYAMHNVMINIKITESQFKVHLEILQHKS